MSPIVLGAIATVAGTLLTAAIAFLGTRATLRAAQPKVLAEGDDFQAKANRQNIDSQGAVIVTLRAEIERLSTKSERQDLRITNLEAKLEESEEQQDLLGQQLIAAQEENRNLRQQKNLLEQQVSLLRSQVNQTPR